MHSLLRYSAKIFKTVHVWTIGYSSVLSWFVYGWLKRKSWTIYTFIWLEPVSHCWYSARHWHSWLWLVPPWSPVLFCIPRLGFGAYNTWWHRSSPYQPWACCTICWKNGCRIDCLFTYLYAAFFAAAIGMTLAMLINLTLIGGVFHFISLAGNQMLWASPLLLGWGEGFLSGAVIALIATYYPEWLYRHPSFTGMWWSKKPCECTGFGLL